MLAVRLPESEVRPLLSADLSIAAINGPSLCVVAGPYEAVDAFEKLLGSRAVVSRRLHTSHAFHSAMVDPVIAPLLEHVRGIKLAAPRIPYVSCVTGDWIQAAEATSPDYWARHARVAVRFADGIAKASELSAAVFLEVGPGATLTTLALQATRGRNIPAITSMQDAALERRDYECLLESAGRLWIQGIVPDWRAIHGAARVRVPLPTYPFERSRHWIDAPSVSAAGPGASAEPPAALASTPDNATHHVSLVAQPAAGSPVSDLSSVLADIFEDLSGERPAASDTQTSFLEMGYDSLFLTQVAQKIQSQTKVKVTFRQLLGDFSTLERLAAHLLEQMPTAPVRASSGPPGSAAQPATAPVAAVPPAKRQEPAAQPSRFAVFTSGHKSAELQTTVEQQAHIGALVARYTRKTAGSQSFTQAHRAPLADPRAASGFRKEWKDMVYPIVVATATGSQLVDIDGNKYTDLVNGFGQTALGHSPPFVVEAVKAQLDLGFAIGPQAELAGKVATMFCEMTGNERMTFCNTGSEAVMAAIRIARTVTGRQKVVIFNGDYHGQFDEVPGQRRAAQRQRAAVGARGARNPRILGREHDCPGVRFCSDPAMDSRPRRGSCGRHRRTGPKQTCESAAFRLSARGPQHHRRIRHRLRHGRSRYRLSRPPGGMQAVIGIRADLATYGKVVGGGLPIGVLAGRAKFMDALDGGQWQFGDDSVPEVGVTFFAGTFVRHPLVLAAAWAVLNHLKDHGPLLQETLNKKTAALVGRLRALFRRHRLHSQIESYASWFFFHLQADHPLAGLLFYHMRERGIHIQDGFPCFLTTTHSEADFEAIYAAFADSLQELGGVGIVGVADTPDAFPLTESQLEIWLAAQMGDEASCAFNESVSLNMTGQLDVAALQRALSRVVERHDALRATFSATGEELRISPELTFDYPFTDLSSAAPAEAERRYAELVAADARAAFDLVVGPCVRGHLIKLSADRHVFVLTAHHIICDGWSLNVIVNELTEIYDTACRGVPSQLPSASSFGSYAQSQAQRDAADLAKAEGYWLDQFAQRPPLLELPTDRPRPGVKSFAGASLCRRIDARLYQAVKKAGARQGSTLFATLLAACQALMGRLADQSEVVIGVPTAGQSLLDDQTLVGHCVNFLPIRGAWTRTMQIAEFLSAISKRVLDAYEHQNYTFGTLVRKLALPRVAGRLPLTEIQFNLERLADRIALRS